MAEIIYPPLEGPGGVDFAIQGGSQNDLAISPDAGVVRIANSANLGLVSFASATPLIASTTDGTSFATAAFTPTANLDYLIFVGPTKATTPDEPSSFTGTNFLSFQKLATVVNAAATGRVSVYRARSIASPASAALTVTFPGTQTGCFISVVAVTGDLSLSAPYTMVCTMPTGVTAAASPLSLTGLGTNAKTIGAAMQAAVATAPALPAGYTDLHNGTISTPSTGWRTQVKTASDDTFSFTGTGAADLIGIAVGVNPNNSFASINGFAGGYPGRRITLKNNSAVAIGQQHALYDSLVLSPEDAGSVAANRILTPSGDSGGARSMILPPAGTVDLVYDGSVSRWVAEQVYDEGWDWQGISNSRQVVISGRDLTIQGIDTLAVNPVLRLASSGAAPSQTDALGHALIEFGDGVAVAGGLPAVVAFEYDNSGKVKISTESSAATTNVTVEATAGFRSLVAIQQNPDTVSRLTMEVTAAGVPEISWGPGGSAVRDLYFRRLAANVLTFDDGAAGAAELDVSGILKAGTGTLTNIRGVVTIPFSFSGTLPGTGTVDIDFSNPDNAINQQRIPFGWQVVAVAFTLLTACTAGTITARARNATSATLVGPTATITTVNLTQATQTAVIGSLDGTSAQILSCRLTTTGFTPVANTAFVTLYLALAAE